MNKAIRPLVNQNGIALLVALTVSAVLVALSLALHKKMDAAFDASVDVHHQTTLTYMASSGIQVAMAMLAKDKKETQVDSVQEDWANPEKIEEAMSGIVFDNGDVTVVISDERSRIQANALVALPGHEFNASQVELWRRLFERLTEAYEPLQDLDYMVMVNSLKDWIDSGDDDAISGLSGAESSYYEDFDPPYACRNAPLDHLGDLPRIKGFEPELFSGAEEMPLLTDYLTVHGTVPAGGKKYTFDGKININTADVAVLAALLPEDYDVFYAQEMADFRIDAEDDTYLNDLNSPNWYTGVPGLEDVDIDTELITNTSDLFRITATAALSNTELTIETVVKRETVEKTGKWKCKILSWHII